MYPKRTEEERSQLISAGRIINEAMSQKGISLAALSRQTHVDDAHLYRIIRGERKPMPTILNRIADYLTIPRSALLEQVGYISFSPGLSEEITAALKKAIDQKLIELK